MFLNEGHVHENEVHEENEAFWIAFTEVATWRWKSGICGKHFFRSTHLGRFESSWFRRFFSPNLFLASEDALDEEEKEDEEDEIVKEDEEAKIVKEVKRSNSLWRFACGDVFMFILHFRLFWAF